MNALRVLVLDDDAFMLEVLRDMLDGCEVRTESDARSALQALAGQAPDLLICDLSMPDMDGIEFMQAAALAGFSGALLLLSGMDSGVRMAAEHLARAHGLNVIATAKKPLALAQLDTILGALRAGKTGYDGNSYNLTPFFRK